MTKRTGEEIRNIGYFAWKDPLAHLEKMEGPEWKRIVQRENSHFQKGIENAATKKERIGLYSQFQKSDREDEIGFLFDCNGIQIQPNGTFSYKWRWAGEKEVHECAMVYSEGNRVWAIEENSSGNESYTFVCYSKGRKLPIWKYEKAVGPFLCVKDELCYVVEETAPLRYGTCISLQAKTGTERKLIYKEESFRHNLELRMGENKCVFLLSANSGQQKLYVLEKGICKRVGSNCISFFPVGYASPTSKIPCFFGRIESFEAPWTAFGKELMVFPIPNHCRQHRIEFVSLTNNLYIYSSAGIRFLLQLQSGRNPRDLQSGIYEIDINPWSHWKGETSFVGYKTVPGATPEVFRYLRNGEMSILKPSKSYVSRVEHHWATSQDKKKVPFLLVKPKGKVQGLMVVVYGGYGLPTHIGTKKWKEWLNQGWCIVFGFIRGGGDMGDSWADEGRTYRKFNSIYDTETVIRKSQELTGLSSENTCIYGRSAGGYTVGSLVSKHGNGDLFGAAYMVVPYVDVLRTTTNPELPLTVLEYDEFGNPEGNLLDLQALLELSPVDSMPERGAPSIFLVCRTSMNDMEVLPYESVKWILKSRGYPTPTDFSEEKYLCITSNHGHFVRGSLGIQQNMEDFLLLQTWLTS